MAASLIYTRVNSATDLWVDTQVHAQKLHIKHGAREDTCKKISVLSEKYPPTHTIKESKLMRNTDYIKRGYLQTCLQMCKEGLNSQILQHHAQVNLAILVDLPLFLCLRCNCNLMRTPERYLRFASFVLKFAKQNEGGALGCNPAIHKYRHNMSGPSVWQDSIQPHCFVAAALGIASTQWKDKTWSNMTLLGNPDWLALFLQFYPNHYL